MSSSDPHRLKPQTRYPRALQRIHWLIAGLVGAQLAMAIVLTQLRSLEFGQWVLSAHRQAGLLVLVLLVSRFVIARRHAVPKEPIAGLPDWQRLAAVIVHRMFYVLLAAQPVIGIFESWSRGDSIGLLGLFAVAAPFDMSDDVRTHLLTAHIAVASILLALVAVHIGAIVFNRWIRGVAVIERMLPAAPAETLTNRTPVGVQMMVAFGTLIAVTLLAGMYSVGKYRDVTRLTAAFESGEVAAADATRTAQVAWKELLGAAAGVPSSKADAHSTELAAAAKSGMDDAVAHLPAGATHDAMMALAAAMAAATPGEAAWQPATLKSVDAALQDVVDTQSADLFQRRTDNTEQAARGHDLVVVAMVPTLTLGLFIAVLLSRSINGSLQRMSILVRAVTNDKSDGDLKVIGRGEFSVLMRDMLSMRAAVEARGREMLDMRAAVAQCDAESAAQALNFESERARLAQEQHQREAAAEARDRLSREQQRSRLTSEFEKQVAGIVESVASTVMELKATATRMADSASNTTRCNSDASSLARKTSETASAIAPAADRLSAAAAGFRQHAEHSRDQALTVVSEAAEARTQITSLGGAARQIVTIADEISDIARQTSLLAINARIQAALAGESGAGFAVVATEVKELATKTRSAVDGIGAQIERVTSVATRCEEFLQRVVERIESLENAAAGICSSADAQYASTTDIAGRMAEIGNSTQLVARNIDAAQGTASATETMAVNVVQAADVMEQRAQQLQDQVASFLLQMQEEGAAAAPVLPSVNPQRDLPGRAAQVA